MKIPDMTFTITTSQRIDLFIKTMDSFLDKCKDVYLIKRWICSDDRSNEKDFREMQRLYPFMEFYKSYKPGQAANLNNLFSRVETPIFFHSEDDWLYVREGEFLTEMYQVMMSDSRIRNVILRFWDCMYIKDDDLEYRMHIFYNKCKIKDISPDDLIAKADMAWFGYSLNPGLQHTETVRKLGKYDETTKIEGDWGRYFDRPQAQKYLDMGLKRANLNENYVEHIGEVSVYDMYPEHLK